METPVPVSKKASDLEVATKGGVKPRLTEKEPIKENIANSLADKAIKICKSEPTKPNGEKCVCIFLGGSGLSHG